MSKSKLKNELRLTENSLVLFRWCLEKFGFHSIKEFREFLLKLKDTSLEGISPEGYTNFYSILQKYLHQKIQLNDDLLKEYDLRILSFWKEIIEKRERKGEFLNLKYFQYLSLLFSELYLDYYFHSSEKLIEELNHTMYRMNLELVGQGKIEEFQKEDLHKLAFWCATGSGKTLLMHIHIKQYLYYLKKTNRNSKFGRILLLVPNEGLALQHLKELELSHISSQILVKATQGEFSFTSLSIITIHQLGEKDSEKTMATESFGKGNLVLIDEGHKGLGSSDSDFGWMKRRDILCEDGFSFEYSATFGQAVNGSKNQKMIQEYSKSILFDYSYKYFYDDGYGKNFKIYNLSDTKIVSEIEKMYLTASLLAFFQQVFAYSNEEKSLKEFKIEKPLWIFAGSKVNATDKNSQSDVLSILKFLADFLNHEIAYTTRIQKILNGVHDIIDSQGKDIFTHSFNYLKQQNLDSQAIYSKIVKYIFHTDNSCLLHAQEIKGSGEGKGEILLRAGENIPFGVINIGKSSEFLKLCKSDADNLIITGESEFSESLFHSINRVDSNINILIGSKKFSEGWSSWRVSSMGLMNMGKTEGSEIIQLFGRGVRLKGYEYSLKRSNRLESYIVKSIPEELSILETLQIFGVKAEYMRQFRTYLEEEGIVEETHSIEIPITTKMPERILHTLSVHLNMDFNESKQKVDLTPNQKINKVVLDLYPKIYDKVSDEIQSSNEERIKNKQENFPNYLKWINFEEIYIELKKYKQMKMYWNLHIEKNHLSEILKNQDWYEIYADQSLFFQKLDNIEKWNKVAISLLKNYTERIYYKAKAIWQEPHLKYIDLTEDDPNFGNKSYKVEVKGKKEDSKDLWEYLDKVKKSLQNGTFHEELTYKSNYTLNHSQLQLAFVDLSTHLYKPLAFLRMNGIHITPTPLNEGEKNFIVAFKTIYQNKNHFLKDIEIYLLRNRVKKGIGFFEESGFYPDFILWILFENKEHIVFIDPKGILYEKGFESPKVHLHKRIQELENKIKTDEMKNIHLHSFLVSDTKFEEVKWWSINKSIDDFHNHNIFFMEEDDLIEKILKKVFLQK